MRTWFVILVFLFFTCQVNAELHAEKRYSGYPQGTFKKSMTGKIIQYDKNGKKVGVYKLNSTRKYKKQYGI